MSSYFERPAHCEAVSPYEGNKECLPRMGELDPDAGTRWRRNLTERMPSPVSLPESIDVPNGWQGVVTELLDELARALETASHKALQFHHISAEGRTLAVAYAVDDVGLIDQVERIIEKSRWRAARTCRWCGREASAGIDPESDAPRSG